jgi:SAM-dependent methyltransferase
MERYLVPVYLPRQIFASLRATKRIIFPPKPHRAAVDLSGDRDIEWSYIASRLPVGRGRVLDFGCGYGNMSIHAIQKGYSVLALDLLPCAFPWSHPNLETVCGDLLRLDLAEHQFDYILNCSSVEHVGLTGRYGVAAQETDGDLAAMAKMQRLLKPAGKMLMTIPCGRDAAIVPWHRVYGEERLPRLLESFEVEEQVFWTKRADNRWNPATREEALSYVPTSHPTIGAQCTYALGCFTLRPKSDS